MPILAAAAALLFAAFPAETDLDRLARQALPATVVAEGVILHYDPGAIAEGVASAEARRASAALRALEARLETRLEGAAEIFLYRDAAEFAARTGAPAHWECLASGPRSIHLPRGAAIRHEIAHLLAQRFPGAAGRDPGGLLREGLAVWVEGDDRGIPVAVWAAVCGRVGLLPPLADLRDLWPEGPPRPLPDRGRIRC